MFTKAEMLVLIEKYAAGITSEGNGLPMDFFVQLADKILGLLVGYSAQSGSRAWLRRQDVDYLARHLQAVHMLLGDDNVNVDDFS